MVQSKQKCQRPGAVPGGKGACPWESDWACARLRVTRDKGKTSAWREAALRQAADQGANLALLPEMFNCPYENPCFPSARSPPGETWQFLAAMARLGGCTWPGLCAGLEGTRCGNTCYLFSPKGRELAHHRKVHLFDIDVPGASGSRSQTPWPSTTRSRWWTPSGHAGPCHLL